MIGAGAAEVEVVLSAVLVGVVDDEVVLAEDWVPGIDEGVLRTELAAALLEGLVGEPRVDGLDDVLDPLGTVTETPVIEGSGWPDSVGATTISPATAAGADTTMDPASRRVATASRSVTTGSSVAAQRLKRDGRRSPIN